MQQSFSVSLEYILMIPFNFSILAVHMWYIYLLIGLYLYLPVFSAWVEKASERAKLMFLLAWGVTLLLPYYYQFVSNYLWGTCSWNSFGMTLSEESGMELEKNVGDWHSDVCSRLCGDILRFQTYNCIAGIYG